MPFNRPPVTAVVFAVSNRTTGEVAGKQRTGGSGTLVGVRRRGWTDEWMDRRLRLESKPSYNVGRIHLSVTRRDRLPPSSQQTMYSRYRQWEDSGKKQTRRLVGLPPVWRSGMPTGTRALQLEVITRSQPAANAHYRLLLQPSSGTRPLACWRNG